MEDENCIISEDKIQKLEYAQDYIGLEPFIQVNYIETKKEGFHMVHNPIEPDDSIPQKKKHIRDGRLRAPIYTADFFAKRAQDSDDKKASSVGGYSLSNFEDPFTLASVLDSQFKKRDDEYKQRIGTFIVKVNYEEEDGLIGPTNEQGHFDFLPYKGFTLETRIDQEFGYQPYEIFLNNEDK